MNKNGEVELVVGESSVKLGTSGIEINGLKKEETKMEVTGRVYIRSEAGQSSSQLGILEVGEVVEVLETVDGWHKLENGFVMQGFLK